MYDDRVAVFLIGLAFCGALGSSLALGQSGVDAASGFPKLAGINIGAKNYDDIRYQDVLAKLDLVILGFYRGWKGDRGGDKIGAVVDRLKSINPDILIGQYTILNETRDNPEDTAKADIRAKVTAEDWWARNASGDRVQWTSKYNAYDLNFTVGSLPDAQGLRFPQWIAERDYNALFSNVNFDIWYFDNVMWRPRVTADWNRDGVDDSRDDSWVQEAYREGHVAEWKRAKELSPNIITIGNADNDLSTPEYKGRLQGALLECLVGKSWSVESQGGWSAAMTRYRAALANTAEPRIVIFQVCGDPLDYRLFRYGFTSALMDDGYFVFSKDYSSVSWFDEYDVDLGPAVDDPPTVPGADGLYRRRFEKGLVLVNPTDREVTTSLVGGYRRIHGEQASEINNGDPVSEIRLSAKDGVVLVKTELVPPALRLRAE